jgi:hypothetical protein
VDLAVGANLIFISAGAHPEFPACVRCWIESVLPRKQGASAFLVALLQPPSFLDPMASTCTHYLRQLAARYGVEFLCNLDAPAKVKSKLKLVLSELSYGAVLSQAPQPFEIGV